MFLLYDRLILEINISTELKYKIPDVLIRIEQLMIQCIVTCFTTQVFFEEKHIFLLNSGFDMYM